MSVPTDDLARAAAKRLAPRYGRNLPTEVEKQILAGPEARPRHYVGVAEGVAIAALILQCAEFAWQIYQDTRNKDAIRRELRLRIGQPGKVTIAQRDEVITVVVDQLPPGA